MIEVVALDVYGTILAWGGNRSFPPAPGLEIFLDRCDERGIKVVTSSDAAIDYLKQELEEVFNNFPERRLSLSRFHKFFCLDTTPKDFSLIYGRTETGGYDIVPGNLLVIGDSLHKDIYGALKQRCPAIHVKSPYSVGNNGGVDKEYIFDFAKIDLDKIMEIP